jgi:AcrR family transcriptional regulator
MGRRSEHTADELRELVLQAASEIIETQGLAGLSARAAARKIGYSAGTLYNVFANLDDLILNVEAQLLDQLDARLDEAVKGQRGEAAVIKLTRAFMAFARERPKLWDLLSQHHLPGDVPVPPWYSERIEMPQKRIATALGAAIPAASDAQIKRASRTIWASLHGIAALATAQKIHHLTAEQATDIVDHLVRNYLTGFKAECAK